MINLPDIADSQIGCRHEAAITLLHTHSRGILRRIGLLATHALLDAAVNKTPLVEETSVRRAITELDD